MRWYNTGVRGRDGATAPNARSGKRLQPGASWSLRGHFVRPPAVLLSPGSLYRQKPPRPYPQEGLDIPSSAFKSLVYRFHEQFCLHYLYTVAANESKLLFKSAREKYVCELSLKSKSKTGLKILQRN